jgi:uncharacterized protein with PIN domain
MATARFRFHDALNDFLPPARQRARFTHVFDRRASIKDMVEALGVPHPEIGRLVVGGARVDFGHIVADGDRIDVYPIEAASGAPCARAGQPIRFALDANLGALARYLRLCGFDTRYRNAIDDGELAALAAADERVLLTRDRDVLKRRIVSHGYFVRADDPRDQLAEVVRRFALAGTARPFTRCSRCNGALEDVDKARIAHRLKPLTKRYYDTFRRCRDCDRIYWRGTHVAGIEALVGCVHAHGGDGSGAPKTA